jgi:hypothetical protein
LSTKVPLRNDRNQVFGLVGIAETSPKRKRAEVLRDGQSQILQMIAMSAPLEEVLGQSDASRRIAADGDLWLRPAARRRGDALAARRRAELAEAYTKAIDGICIGPRQVVRHRRLSAGDGDRCGHCAGSALGRVP